jgi:hypothetical protein
MLSILTYEGVKVIDSIEGFYTSPASEHDSEHAMIVSKQEDNLYEVTLIKDGQCVGEAINSSATSVLDMATSFSMSKI